MRLSNLDTQWNKEKTMLSKEFTKAVDAMKREDLKEAYAYIGNHQTRLTMLNTIKYCTGQNVQFESRGMIHKGIVEKINKTSISVKVGMVKWRVSPHLLTIVE